MPSDAEICRRNGWGVGRTLYGYDPMRGEQVSIRITAVGESAILARRKGATELANWNLCDWEDLKAVRTIPAPPTPVFGAAPAAAGREVRS